MRGVYVLVLVVPKTFKKRVGSLGLLELTEGCWVYIGSAMGSGSTSLENRLKRHFSATKTLHWHIDYIIDAHADVKEAVFSVSEEPMECRVAQKIKDQEQFIPGPNGFGASDCTYKCGTHLFKYVGREKVDGILSKILEDIGLLPVFASVTLDI